MKQLKTLISALALSFFAVGATSALASDPVDGEPAVAPEVEEAILKRLRDSDPRMPYGSVEPAPVTGLYQVQIENGPLLYVAPDGSYVIQGKIYGAMPGGFVDLQELAMGPKRSEALAAIDKDDMVIFPAEGETKSHVYIFTDIDCGYCRKLHREVSAINKLGIEVRYLGYPRAGVGSPSHKKLVSVMCADDRQKAMTDFKANPSKALGTQCENSSVAEQFKLGGQLGVAGTPAIITADGQLLPGYMPADALGMRLGI